MRGRSIARVDRLVREAMPPLSEQRMDDLLAAAQRQIDDETSSIAGAVQVELSSADRQDDRLPLLEITPEATPGDAPNGSVQSGRRRWPYLAAAAILIAIAAGIVGLATHHSSPASPVPHLSGRPTKPVPTTTCWNGSVVGASDPCPAPPTNDSPPSEPQGCVHQDTVDSNKFVYINVLQAWTDPDGDQLSIASAAPVSKNGVTTITHLHDGTPAIIYEGDQPGIDFVFYTVSDGVNPPVQGTCELILTK